MLARKVTVGELMTSMLDAGHTMAWVVALLPVLFGLVAFGLRQQKRRTASQTVANASIGLGFFSLLVVVCWVLYASGVSGMIEQTNVLVFLAPVYLLAVSFLIENWLHPGKQEDVRGRIRKVILFVIILGVLYFILSRLNMHMVIWTNIVGFVFFIMALIGILYLLVRKVV